MLKNISGKNQIIGWGGKNVELKPNGLLDVAVAFDIPKKDVYIMEDKMISNHRLLLEKVDAPKADEVQTSKKRE